MDTLLPTPAVIAHRGASAYAPENTLPAFELAVTQNADAVELDAKLTRDGEVVVIHDRSVDRTTNGSGLLHILTYREIKLLDAGSWFSPKFKGVRIPTLGQVFEAVGKKIVINIELTNYAAPLDGLAEKTAALINEHQIEDWVFVSSFNPLALFKFHRLLPDIPIGLLALPGPAGALPRSWLGNLVPYQALHPHFSSVTPKLIHKGCQRGKRIQCYTVNREADMKRLFAWGIGAIFTDDPIKALAVRRELSS